MRTLVCRVLAVLVIAAASLGAQQLDAALFSGMHWRSIGPYRSGNVYAVAGIPGDSTTYYLGLPEGGVWKTTDAGTVWTPIFDHEGVPSIGSVAVATSSPKTVYVGTGDPTGWAFTPGQGVFKSTDAGATWQRMGLAETQYIPALLVDPRNADVVLIGALGTRGGRGGAPAPSGPSQRGVFRSTDGGRTWRNTFTASAVADMAWDERDPSIVYIVVQRAAGGFGRGGGAPAVATPLIYKSTDEGISWQAVGGAGLPADLRSANIAVANGTRGERVYIIGGGLAGGRATGVYRSDDGGATWTLGTTEVGSAGGRIYADPNHPDTVYLMGTSMYRSTDGAHTFISYKGAPGGDDYRALWIDPTNSNRLLAGVDQGPTISVDGGRTWTPWYNLANGQFYDVFTDNQTPYWVYGSQQDSGTAAVVHRSDYGDITDRDWYPVGGFEDGSIAVDPLNPRWVYTQGWYHVMRRFDRTTGQVAVFYTPTPEDRFNGNPPTLFSPVNPHRLYVASQVVRATDDGGRTWMQLGGDLTVRAAVPGAGGRGAAFAGRGGANIQSLAPSPIAAGVLWAGTSNGIIQVSRDGGQTWKNVSPPALTARSAVNRMDASHHDPATAYAAIEDAGASHPELYRTTDYGATWEEIVQGLPEQYKTRVVREDPVNPNLLYAGTEWGAYVSFDRGDQWQPLQLDLPHTVVSDMKVQGDDVVISTYGRSFWILDDITPLRQASAAAAATAGVYFYQPQAAERVRWSNNQDTPLPPEVPAGQNPPEGAILDYYLKSSVQGPITLGIYDSAGRLVNQFSNTPPPPDTSPGNVPDYWFKPPAVLETSAGMHRFVWDLRYPDPKALTYSYYGNMIPYTEYTLTWHAIAHDTPRIQPVGPLAVPGRYTLKLTVDGQTYTRPLTIGNDPRSAVTAPALALQLSLERRDMAGLAVSYNAYYLIDAQRKALAAAQASGDAALAAAAKALDGQIAELSSGTASHGFGIANRDLARHLQDLDFGDFEPNASMIAGVNASCGEISTAIHELDSIEQKSVPALNEELSVAHLAPLTPVHLPDTPPCAP